MVKIVKLVWSAGWDEGMYQHTENSDNGEFSQKCLCMRLIRGCVNPSETFENSESGEIGL